ncbi:hypothetical protein [Pararhodobacter oceanensis]|uniref:hypothetical protein n=1 Tax=Pararhodobacter oceanensis TaxID=2172121 RepID=UPI003A936753
MTAIPEFKSDCSACAALCCMALAFDRGEDFALDKAAQTPCPNLDTQFACTIHESLENKGFGGCARYDCLGAGQRVTQEVFAGRNWREQPELLAPMASAFRIMRQIHRDLELLLVARRLPLPEALAQECGALIVAYHPPAGWTPELLAAFQDSDHMQRTKAFLQALRAYV